MSRGLDWNRAGADWPNREYSRFVVAGDVRWHVQVTGSGPVILLLHGAGASTHSWRGLLAGLADAGTVVAPDLPGHAFSSRLPRRRQGFASVSQSVVALCETLDVRPVLIVGHSAGAAIGARLLLDTSWRQVGLVSLCGALLPLRGLPGHLYGPAARLMAANPLAPVLFSLRARSGGMIERLIARTGSRVDREGIDFYRRLASHASHVGGVIDLMSRLDLAGLARDLPDLHADTWIVAGEQDGLIAADEAERVRQLLPRATVTMLPGLGHLAHEEAPRVVAALIRNAMDTVCRCVARQEEG